ncbi:MAG TPA: glycosyltransferase [Solirubrobacteraceae bacterium]|nr:glycosyltransferase [Solirubrobacteraceae bacterium]
MRALVLSNMRPDQAHPERGSFVRDQVAALRRLDGLDVELYEFPPGPRALASAARELRRRFSGRRRAGASSAGTGARPRGPGSAGRRFDVVHAHFGLTAWPALAVPAHARALTLHGTDLRHPRTRLLTLAALPSVDLLAVVSAALADELPARAARRAEVLPCGVELERFRALSRAAARAELGLDAQGRYALFAADPARPEKRYDRAVELAAAAGAELLTLGGVEPARVPLLVNAANAVLVPSEREGFGLAVLEALACDVPVLATPVGVHEQALAGVPRTLCAPFELARWRAALAPLLADEDPRVPGRASAERWSAVSMAQRVADAWRTARGRAG